MSYHNTTPNTGRRSTTNSEGLLAPPGFHYMPNGVLMADGEHALLYKEKVIKAFNINTKNLKSNGETRQLKVIADNGAVFSLEIQNDAREYYNFQTKTFQAFKTRLSNIVVQNSVYSTSISFPLVSSADQYNFSLFSEENTVHDTNREVRFVDGSLDINSSTGSNSKLMQKVIYQTSAYSANGLVSVAAQNSIITVPVGSNKAKIPFTVVLTTNNAAKSLELIRQPVADDIAVYVEAVVGDPVNIPGENIYPTITTAAVETDSGGTTVNGSSTGTTVTTHVVSSTIATVGDRVLGNAALAAATVTVTEVSGGSGKTFTISEAISIADDLPLSFSNQKNFRFPLSSTSNNLSRLSPGMKQVGATMFSSHAVISNYLEQITIFENEANEYTVDKVSVPAIDFRGVKPTITRNSSTKVVTELHGTSSNPIHVTFDKQGTLQYVGNNAKIFSYGEEEIYRISGWDVEFTDLKAVLSPVVTNTSSSTIGASSTTVGVDSRQGIVDGISTVSGIGINPSAVNPTVSSGATDQSASGNIVLSAAQEIEDNAQLTFANASRVVTITGFAKIKDTSDKNLILRIDPEKFLIQH